MSKLIVLITGANTGLGYETCRALFRQSKPATIIMACRSTDKAEEAAANLKKEYPDSSADTAIVECDITSDDSLKSVYKYVEQKFGHLDVLVNNAGGQMDQKTYDGSMGFRDLFVQTANLNLASPHVTTWTLAPLLLKSTLGRIIFITSGTSPLSGTTDQKIAVNHEADAGWPKKGFQIGLPAYRTSKTGLNMLMREWVRYMAKDNVKVFAISPGWLATGLGHGVTPEKLKEMGAVDPSVGGEVVSRVILGERDADAGYVVSKDGRQDW